MRFFIRWGSCVPMCVSCVILVCVGCLPREAIASSIPAWVQAQTSAPVPEHDGKVDAALLYSESVLSVQPDGQLKHLERRVCRILRMDGQQRGIVRVDFDTQTRINSLHAWSLPKDGKPYDLGMRESVETSIFGVQDGELVSDLRSRILRIPAAVPGSTIAYEYEVLERPRELTDEWLFEDTIPTREAHYSVELPPGWSLNSTWINHAPEAPVTSTPRRTEWVLRNLRPIELEDDMPPWRGVAGRLVISLVPPAGRQPGFQNWHDMGVWYQGLVQGRADASAQIKQTVAQKTQSATTTLAKLRALAAFVQNDIRYVAIELGIGGLQPHTASDVFVHRYGDCKDKATLLKAMLQEIGVESHYFIINTVRGSIGESTPANLGFDHVILVIRLPAEVSDPALLATAVEPKLGRVLFFDPTDPLTPLGRLRGSLQASFGLLVTDDGGELVRTPQLEPGTNAIERTAHMTLDENGTLTGDVREVWSGDKSSAQRAALQAADHDTDVIKPVEKVAAESFATFDILKASMVNARASDQPFEWRYTVQALNYAKTAGDLLLVRPRIIGTKTTGFLETADARHHPIEFDGVERDVDVFEIAFPAGFEVDELPHPVKVDYGYIAYESKTEAVGHTLRYTRTFERKELSVPVAKAQELKRFYRIVSDDERNSAVLKPVAAGRSN